MKNKGINKRLLFLIVSICATLLLVSKTEAASSKYYIKVNKKTNVATVYLTKTKKPQKAFLVSCGKATPTGTFYTMNKYKWRALVANSYGQYATRITGRILFHSVWYYKNNSKSTMAVAEYNKLGTTASHGCVRLSVENAKWIYDNCKLKTKVIIFNGSKKNDPLGKPKLKKMTTNKKKDWDPTDPDKKNPYNKISYKGVSTGTKTKSVNTSINVLKGAKASTKWGRNLTSKIKVTVKKPGSSKYTSTKASIMKLNKLGTYKFKYSVTDSKTKLKKDVTVSYVVKDTKAPTISGVSENNIVNHNDIIKLKQGISATNSAKQNLTSKIVVSVMKPLMQTYEVYTKDELIFNVVGEYRIQYSVKNPNNGKTCSKVAKYTVIQKEVENVEEPSIGEESENTDATLEQGQ